MRRIGGRDRSQRERESQMQKFFAAPGGFAAGGWKHQCFCGSVEGKRYRGSVWCRCGRERMALGAIKGECGPGCELCELLAGALEGSKK